ncbi:hypothetical protein E2562_003778 [Oryza meyeriana var. granulata]|uniref:tRNA-binding domain-containing protein n=1 Tax=Oryza meyeriana var. granulata TaxID=110450 RepID=A0A6G1BS53_9ORYZ|nr:hypothetical protein E2562_003778 [Oryza meyeriana var. granulata]
MAAARMALSSCCRLHLLPPSSSASLPTLARTRGVIAKPIPLLAAPSPTARSASLLCYCSSSSSDATVAPAAPQAVEEEKKAEVPVEELAALLDIRVGRVVKAWRHPEADTLYVEEVDVGEEQPRTICSGLVNYLPLEQLQV